MRTIGGTTYQRLTTTTNTTTTTTSNNSTTAGGEANQGNATAKEQTTRHRFKERIMPFKN